MSGLDDRQRRALERLVVDARATLESDLADTLRGSYGIHADGTVEPEERLAPEPVLRARRRILAGILDHLRADGTSRPEAAQRIIREAAFTHLNRLLAIRVADALGILAPSLRHGAESSGFRQVLDVAPLLATADDTGGYWAYLQLCAAELAGDAPALFDPRNPLLALRPSNAALDTVVSLLADPAAADLWDADDTFGWAYQFFNTRDERQQMRAESPAPRDSRELAVRNQFFTPAYVVGFLTQNTLGRRLVAADPATPLVDQLPLLVDPPAVRGAPLDLAQVKVLDPACGSGHFLLGCYDILEAAWQNAGVTPAEAAPRIVPCLWGIDIDPRVVQIAQAAIIFRARRACGRAPLPPPNVVCARALPDDPAGWETATAELGADLTHLVDAMRAALRDAPVLGPLLQAEQRLASEIRARVAFADDTVDDLLATSGIARDAFGTAERAVIAALQRAADAASSTVAERLLAAGAGDAVRFLEAIRNRYDAVLMNPPFGEPVPETKDYIKATYPWIPTRDYNLLAAFVGRGIDLCNPDGFMGAITSRAGMFLKTFGAWRSQVLLGHQLVALADFGFGVMEQAMVEAAAYVLSPQRASDDHAGVYIRLLKDADRPVGLAAAIAADRNERPDPRIFRVANAEFAAIPGSPMAYWMGESIRRLFVELPRLQGNGVDVKVGLQTGDDFRFLRLFWEIDPLRISLGRDPAPWPTPTGPEPQRRKRWTPFAKGGEYSPFWSDIHLVVDFERNGEVLRAFPGSVVRNAQFYFRAGLTWPRRTQGGFNPSVLPEGCAFGDKGPGIFTRSTDESLLVLSGLLSRPALLVIGSMTTFGSYEVGAIQNTPRLGEALDKLAREDVVAAAREVINSIAMRDLSDETSRNFSSLKLGEGTIAALVRSERTKRITESLDALREIQKIDELYCAALGLDDDSLAFLRDQLGPAIWEGGSEEAAGATEHAANPLGPFLVDEELECHARAANIPLEAAAKQLLSEVPSSDALAAAAGAFVSWLTGVAFGRWDLRSIAAPVALNPFGCISVCPPGMLVGPDGFPTMEAPPEYPVTLPPDGILLDEPGHPQHIAHAVEAAASAAYEHGEELLADAVRILGKKTLRDYLAKAFFKEHLGRYSKSRRQAPVYWQLTVPSGRWSAWLYAPRFSREMLYALAGLIEHRQALAAEQIRALTEDPDAARRNRKVIDDERTLAAELTEFGADVERLAGLGWRPDLDDGAVLCAAPLARWFPAKAWPKLAEHLAKLKAGDYPWASVHRYREAL